MPDSPSAPPPFVLPQARVEDVFSRAEEVRASDYPSVPAELLSAVLAAERDNPDSRTAAARAVRLEVEGWLLDHPDESATGSPPEDGGPAL